MSIFVFANNVNTTLAAAASNTATTLTLASSANLPTLSAGQIMPLTINDAATGLIYEVVYVTAITGASLTVTRGQEGTTAQNWSIGDYAFSTVTEGSLAVMVQEVELQNAQYISASAAGTSDAITATFTPAISALTAGMTLYVRAGSANTTTTPTFTPNSGTIAAKTIVKGAGSALAAGDIAGAGHWLTLQYDATLDKWVLLNPATGVSTNSASVQGAYKNLSIVETGVNNYSVVITADEVVLENSVNQYMTVRAVNKTINANGTVGAPLSSSSALVASTWYYRWLWYNATNGLTATLDTSSTAPTAPTGYASTDYKAKLPNASLTDGTANKYLIQQKQANDESQFVTLAGSNLAVLPTMASGVAGSPSTPTWVAVGTSGVVPPTAKRIKILLSSQAPGANSQAIAAPNSTYGAFSGSSNPPPAIVSGTSTMTPGAFAIDMLLESTNIYWASAQAAGLLQCLGYKGV